MSLRIGVGLFARHAEQMAAEALADTRVVVVNGARQVPGGADRRPVCWRA
jgi:hypothetical protein